jgi:hypothetical protein
MAHVQLTTETKNYHSFPSFAVTATTAEAKSIATTRPTAVANRSTVFGASLNYMKFKIYCSGSTPAPGVYIYGWNYCPEVNGWIPQLLYSGTTTLTAANQTLPGVGSVREVATHTKLTGDGKLFDGSSGTSNGGFLLVDTLGCEYLEASFTVATGSQTITVIAAGL